MTGMCRKKLVCAAVLFSLVMPAAWADVNQDLIQAALAGHTEALAQALDAGAELEIHYSERDLTPLMLAIYRDHFDAVRFLLARGANVNARNNRGHTPLILAASGGQSDLIPLLLAKGAELDATEEMGNTALLWAAYWGHLDVIKILLEAGASVSPRNDDGDDVLIMAAQGGLSQHTRQLVKGRNRMSAMGRQLPLLLSDAGETELLAYLLDKGARDDTRNRLGQTPVILLAIRGKGGPIQMLAQRGADLYARDQDGLSAFDHAVRHGHVALAQWLKTQTR